MVFGANCPGCKVKLSLNIGKDTVDNAIVYYCKKCGDAIGVIPKG